MRLPAGFESLKAARRERSLRAKALIKVDGPASGALGRKVGRCRGNTPCNSAACSTCFRSFRIGFLKEARELHRRFPESRVATVIIFDRAVAGGLASFDLVGLKDRLRKQLQRSGFSGVAFGLFEMNYHTAKSVWLPHFHLLISDDGAWVTPFRRQLLKAALASDFCADVQRPRPLLIQPIRDPDKQLSYLAKSYWSRVEHFESRSGSRTMKGRRLQVHEHLVSLLALDRFGFSALTFRYGTRRCLSTES